jgi:hypothetical protein
MPLDIPVMALIGSGALLVVGTAFAFFLGIASERIERQREHDIEAQQHAAGGANAPVSHAA